MANTKPLKIGFLLDTSLDPNDGVQQYVLALGEWLTKEGHDVSYIVGETKTRKINNLYSLAKNITVSFNGNKTTIPLPTSKKKIRKFLNIHDFDVIHVQSPHSPFFSHKIIKLLPLKTAVIGTFHILPYGSIAKTGNKLLGYSLRRSIRRIDKMLAVSDSAKEFCKTSFRVDSTVLPNVIDYQRFADAAPLEKYNDKKLNILFLGRLVKRKGCQSLIEAVSLLDEEAKMKIRLIICGKGELYNKLRDLADRLNLSKITLFEGYVEESKKPSIYASADISVFPSISGESFGIVLLEAMASGKAAVLAGNNPGYTTVMNPNKNLLFNPNDPNELAKKLELFINNDQLRSETAKWGSEYTKNYDVNVVGHKLVDIYREEIAKKQTLQDN